jgi:hypothetical protein
MDEENGGIAFTRNEYKLIAEALQAFKFQLSEELQSTKFPLSPAARITAASKMVACEAVLAGLAPVL